MLARNGDLAAAAISVHAAQLQARLTHTGELPTLAAEYDGAHARGLARGGSATSHALTGTVSYEADLWGKLAQLTDAARWEALATQQDRQHAPVADRHHRQPVLEAGLRRSASPASRTAWPTQRVLELVRVQRAAGAASPLEMLEAEQSPESERATLSQLQAQQAAARLSLAALLADPAADGVGAAAPVLAAGAGHRRGRAGRGAGAAAGPARGGLRLREQFANVNATRASYYPTLALTGTLGTSSTALVDLLKNPIGTLGASLALPLLNWRQRDLSIQSSQASYDKAAVSFRQTLYVALTDVETALSARTRYLQQGEQQQRALAAARAAERVYAVRYRAGRVAAGRLEAQERRARRNGRWPRTATTSSPRR